ncbi:hypothetical protein QWZ03_18085 [Chitinimonas viridis]|uniref:Uncharacterized protein n=1 Tax=Chitinimonas viridis TaxID=664880 RepID=A0ABT8B8W6_9NEIS|nr:hypothetical protein [Chitinimonas viridis]MDN3578679.1 hypothetical protein [Chitinimonas viridis]
MSAQLVLTTLAGLEPTDVATLAAALRCARAQLENSLGTLQRRGFAESTQGGWRLTQQGRQFIAEGKALTVRRRNPGRKTSGMRAKAWWLIRKQVKFSMVDLLSTLASKANQGRSLPEYLRALTAAGYLQPMRKGASGARWMLIRDTGRQAPVWRPTVGEVYDPNLGEVVWRRATA